MTITQYLSQWLRGWLQKPASQKAKVPSKKERQVLPPVPKPPHPPNQFQDEDGPLRYRIYWRM
jgi:hypothetical protein